MNKRLLLAGSVRILARYKLRTFFMSLGIVVGVAALVVTRSIGSGAEQDMLGKLERIFSASSIIIVNTGGSMSNAGRNMGRLNMEDIEAIEEELDQVVDWNPTVAASEVEVQYQGVSLSLLVVGGSERAEFVSERGVVQGEYFTKADVRSEARVALLGHKTAQALFGDDDPLGKQIQIRSIPFRVKGVLEPYGVDPHGMDRDDEIQIPITTIMNRVLSVELIGTAKLLVANVEDMDATVDRISGILRIRHNLADDQQDDFSIYTPEQVQQVVRKANRVLTIYLPATSGIALLVAAIVIANIMLMSVRERIPEIGLRKALGATNLQISGQFLLESLAVTTLSGALGAAVGAGVLMVMAKVVNPWIAITPDAIVLGLAAALVVGLLAGFIPARQAACQEPVDALR